MDKQTFSTNIRAALIAIVATALVNAAVALVSIAGQHIPDFINLILQYGAAHGAIVASDK